MDGLYLLSILIVVQVTFITCNFPAKHNLVQESSSGNVNKDKLNYRLPTNIEPSHYLIQLITPPIPDDDFETNFTFDGHVEISIEVKKVTKMIKLHAKEIEINEDTVEVSNAANDLLKIDRQEYENGTDIYSIVMSKELNIGKYVLTIEYVGQLSRTPSGFYRSHFKYDNTWTAATQFSATGARKAFPCFDEPALKAEFTIEIEHHKDFQALSNMPASTTTKKSKDQVLTKFNKSGKMSTYIVAFVLMDFVATTNKAKTHTVWVPKVLNEFAAYSLDVAESSLNTMIDFTKQPYQLPKLDHVPVPVFEAGAMENWGLILYKRTNLIYMPKWETSESKQHTVSVIAHEISHQWFGNEVTPLWWDYIWLNEGFATFFEYYLPSQFMTKWKMDEQFVINVQQKIMAADAHDMHAIEISVENPNEWTADVIDYQKAGSILRMLSYILTPSVFQKGLQYYLKDMSGRAAEPADLWRNLQKAVDEVTPGEINLNDQTVTDIGNSWIKQKGFPIVSAKINQKKKIFTLTQEKFSWQTSKAKSSNWLIPINFVTAAEPNFSEQSPTHWLSDEPLEIPFKETSNWLIVNPEHRGYYRVNYDFVNWLRIIDMMKTTKFKQISVITRAQLIDDAFNLAAAGYLDYGTVFYLAEYLEREVEYTPWMATIRNLNLLEIHLYEPAIWESYKDFMRTILSRIYNDVHVDEREKTADHVRNLTRLSIIKKACDVFTGTCGVTSFGIVQDLTDDETISPDMQPAVYCTALRYAGIPDQWNKLYNRYSTRNGLLEQDRIVDALGCFDSYDILYNYLDKVGYEGSYIKQTMRAFISVFNNGPMGIQVGLDFMQKRLQIVLKELGGDKVVTILNELASRLVLEEQKDAFVTIVDQLNQNLQEKLESAIKKIDENIVWHNKYVPAIAAWFNKNYPTTSPDPTTQTEPIETTTQPDGAVPRFHMSIYLTVLILGVINMII